MIAADLFCGAGGTTTGAAMSGRVEVKLAINHWRTAVHTHRQNHPNVRHVCAEIDMVNPRDFIEMGIDVVLASPECVFHSNARGGKPADDQRRASAWCVPRWAEVLRPKWIVVENVREFEQWGPLGADNRPLKSKRGETFKAWVQALRSLNYHVEWRLLNAADFGGATKRIRLFIVARRGRSTQPIRWPTATHSRENWIAAATIIDWNRPCPSIFGRKRPLADKTLRRIEIGLRKFCGHAAEPFIVKLRRGMDASAVGDPLNTITCHAGHHALAVPFQLKAYGRNPGATKRMTDPLPTVLGRENHAVVIPFLSAFHNGADGERRNYSIDEPIRTVDTQPRHALVQPFLVPNFGERDGQDPRSHAVDSPLPTVTGHGAGSLVLPFLTSYFSNGKPQSIDEPLSTVTTKHRHGLAMVELLKTMRELSVVDVGFRMLDVDELAAAQGFPRGYYLHGTKAEQIKQIGNSVHTHVAKALCEAIAV
ncbi:MAG TPA: DNA cytosine methyltransferase [Pirellulaceae bacterium]|nr:DNA cytosine methyltransferase [Pirellulaceae bacterium]